MSEFTDAVDLRPVQTGSEQAARTMQSRGGSAIATHGQEMPRFCLHFLLRILTFILFLSLFMLALGDVATAQGNSITLELVGQIGGPTQAVAVQGNYAYAGVGLRLVVLNVSDPTAPTMVGTTEPLPNFVEDVVVNGTVAYVAAGGAGMYMLNISDPANPAVIGTYDTPGYAEGIAVDGKYAYVADGPYGLRIVDVSGSANFTETAFAYPLNYAFDVAVDGQYAYLAAAGAGLLVVDISDPAHPTEIGTYDTPGYAYGVAIANDTAYIADGWESLRVVNVSDPAHPVEVGSYDTPGWAFCVDIVGSIAYVADAFGGLRILDVSDPIHPAELGGYEVSGGHAESVVVASNTAYVADYNCGLCVVDVSDPARPTPIGFYSPLGYARDVAVAGNYTYVAAGTYGLRVVDISDPAHPVQVGAYATQGYAISVAVAGNYAYIAVSPDVPEQGGLHVVDISNSSQPTRVGFYGSTTGAARDMAVVGGIAYVANEFGLELISLADPMHPTHLGFIELCDPTFPGHGSCAVGVAVRQNLAYVAVEFAGLKIVDVSDPSDLKLIGICDKLHFSQNTAVAGNYAFVADYSGLRVVDVSEPTHPTLVGFYDTPGDAYGITVFGDAAYVADAGGGLQVVNVSDPPNPTLAGSYNTPGYAHEVAVVGNHAYVADGNGGMLILETCSNNDMACNESTTRSEISERFKVNRFPARFTLSLNTETFAPSYPTTAMHDTGSASYHVEEHCSEGRPVDYPLGGATGLAGGPASNSSGATLVVTSAADSGPGTLRWCLENAVSGDTIVFDRAVFPPDNPVTITLSEDLPTITQGNLTIDASDAGVILDGSNLRGKWHNGLNINSDGNVIKGLHILNFSGNGVNIMNGAKYNVIGGDRTRGSGPMGEGNLISGNGGSGINIYGADTMGNIVIGNFIGTDASGMKGMGNQGAGVFVVDGASCNRIGGTDPGERNIISGNGAEGVNIMGRGVSNNSVIGNYVGTDVSGTADLGNEGSGVAIQCGAFNNRIEWNLISGNSRFGVCISDWGSSYNTVIGNLIGTDATGTDVITNEQCGVFVGFMGASFNRIGGTTPEERNVISGKAAGGICLCGSGDVGNLVIGNYIGIDIGGTRTIGNLHEGIAVGGNSEPVFIGGMTKGERNVISGNSFGVVLSGSGIDYNWVAGNYIGTDSNGTTALGNEWGVWVSDSAEHNVIQANLISGNKQGGVSIACGSSFNVLRGNCIGMAADGISPLANRVGVNIEAASNTVGGPHPSDGNTIAYNDGGGIQITSFPYNTIISNSIHSHAGTGISISSSDNNTIYHNNFINNTIQAYDNGYNNSWDSGPIEGGNYWSDHVCKGNPSNGSQPYNISGGSSVDRYPFQDPNGWNKPPIANFTYSPENPTDLDKIQFNDTSTDPDGTIKSWYWEFGDDATSTEQNAKHKYADSGTYMVNLTVTDNDGAKNTTSKEIAVSNVAPTADFVYSPENPVVNKTITLDASNSTDPDGNITNYEWDFGDGNITSTTEETINHSYSEAGSYDVTLTVTDNDGATNSTTKIITVYPPAAIFDTGAPRNPYPSIMGTHTGTIKPNHTVIATKLYTYPCAGTGGHTEYIRIYNESGTIAEAKWAGYKGDWHNITFDKTVVLLANKTYKYTIRTGSYPQIHHNRTLTVPDGEITCIKFIDANGKVYYDWIPAIKLS